MPKRKKKLYNKIMLDNTMDITNTSSVNDKTKY